MQQARKHRRRGSHYWELNIHSYYILMIVVITEICYNHSHIAVRRQYNSAGIESNQRQN